MSQESALLYLAALNNCTEVARFLLI